MEEERYQPRVILLHGLARTAFSLRRLAKAVEKDGYLVMNLNYPSRRYNIQELASQLLPTIQDRVTLQTPLHLVSHSMGGLVGRELMHLLPDYNWKNAVFLAPPHGGSHLARTLSAHPTTRNFFQWFYGPAGQQVALEDPDFPLPPCPYGVIAGTQSRSLINPVSWFSHLILDDRSDGTVRVEETHLDRMIDFAEVYVNHTTIMNHPSVHRLVQYFFKYNAFPDVLEEIPEKSKASPISDS